MRYPIANMCQGKESTVTCDGGILVLSSSLLDDRKLLYTDFFKVLNKDTCVRVWATSARNPRFREIWSDTLATIEGFPEVCPFKEFPYNYLRRLNEFVWDYRLRLPSRMSMMRHVWNRSQKRSIRALKLPARVLATMRVEESLEHWLEKLLLSYCRSPEALHRLQAHPPAVVVVTGPNRFEEPAIVAVAKTLRIPTLALIHSWDNLTTKNRMVLNYDGYLVWSEQMKRELHSFYPLSRNVPVYIVGAAQFDVFFQPRFHQTRQVFCASQGLRPEKPILVYALGSPNFLREHHGALYMAERVARGELGDVQLLIRPHPQFDNGKEANLLRRFGSRVAVQKTGDAGLALAARFQDEHQIMEWVNTFRHADVVINLSSTVAIDAAIFDRPIVNLDYDPEPGQPNQDLVRDVNHLWNHFRPIAESGGLWLVKNPEEIVEAVKTYLKHPELHRDKRRWIAEYVCGYLDGHCGERMAQAVIDFLSSRAMEHQESQPVRAQTSYTIG